MRERWTRRRAGLQATQAFHGSCQFPYSHQPHAHGVRGFSQVGSLSSILWTMDTTSARCHTSLKSQMESSGGGQGSRLNLSLPCSFGFCKLDHWAWTHTVPTLTVGSRPQSFFLSFKVICSPAWPAHGTDSLWDNDFVFGEWLTFVSSHQIWILSSHIWMRSIFSIHTRKELWKEWSHLQFLH